MNKRMIYTDAPPEIEEAFERSKRIPNFIDVDSLKRKDVNIQFVMQKPHTARYNGFKNVTQKN